MIGRGIETNLYARFKCDSLKIGMVKHPEVAQFLGGRLYDCVFKYNEASNTRHNAKDVVGWMDTLVLPILSQY
ncbi:hypothetical protein KY290_019497 [Solanum tuberosum]|uniref:Uncharacterized protein n=1 Tax=Solanum tuberosum TaxID=4113 RepID=A0ABQ7VH68_SOLTU|nr:hypothetical protein KY285_018409 [Solanum tuberosum]KAH0763424.1 hypothetical protein KY290_019497 [Solanum tuberosum]